MIRILFMALVLCFALLPKCHAGGIWVGSLTVKNGDRIVLSDDFSKGKAEGWRLENASIVKHEETSPAYLLFLDQHGKVCTSAFRPIFIKDPGVIEYSGMVYLPPVEEQASYHAGVIACTGLFIYSGSSADNVSVDIELRPGENAYRIRLHWNDYSGTDGRSGNVSTRPPVLSPKTWALLTLRLDPEAGLATALLDNEPVLQAAFHRERYLSISHISVWGWLGSDPSKWPTRSAGYAQERKSQMPVSRSDRPALSRDLSVPASGATFTANFLPPMINLSASAGQLTLSWPALQLYSSTNLSPQATWVRVTNASVQSNDIQWLTLPMTGPQQYFRLRTP